MGNKIRVELSHGGGRTAKYNGEPGACFKCGQLGHWARLVSDPCQTPDANLSAESALIMEVNSKLPSQQRYAFLTLF
jgi:Zinc knuckle